MNCSSEDSLDVLVPTMFVVTVGRLANGGKICQILWFSLNHLCNLVSYNAAYFQNDEYVWQSVYEKSLAFQIMGRIAPNRALTSRAETAAWLRFRRDVQYGDLRVYDILQLPGVISLLRFEMGILYFNNLSFELKLLFALTSPLNKSSTWKCLFKERFTWSDFSNPILAHNYMPTPGPRLFTPDLFSACGRATGDEADKINLCC